MALGEKLGYRQDELKPKWASIECRINAEDVEKNFRPAPGRITGLHIPGGTGVRVDRAIYTGYLIPPYYDSMIAKLIVKARTRQDAVVRMRHGLDEFIVEGVTTTIPFHQEIFNHPDFVAGRYDISFLETAFRKTPEAEKSGEVSLAIRHTDETSEETLASHTIEETVKTDSKNA